ncbi:ribonuclease T2 family protein [Yoonia sediminilitoris]|uniref:Ribonuclease T2 n=1 Tax=Yoonia sediminilitoris TaxID=1286148 RepID=A0A2T6K823_9RHOB|nr:ribonuclease T2 [Yoonia sediminilitoris]PUB10835.1 ribonuclease T2 [Yoonia sediminilitoris]RCW90510.1 ribonuclease T2 [Yoonia sediminilitoris]
MRKLLALLCLATPVAADDVAGEFDYYVMALSWSANWCALEGDARNSPQCDPEEDFGWILHGLWPQYERGFPTNCRTNYQAPSRSDTAAMADIMGTSGLAWHQWRKHGVCSGLSSDDYYALSRQAYTQITRPEVLRKLDKTVTLPATLIEEAFIRDNPAIAPDQITITCKNGYIQEARICLTRDLEPRDCAADVVGDCSLEDALFEPIR